MVSSFEVARRLDMVVDLDRHQRPRGMTVPGEPTIWLREERATRMEHACAHEIGHHHVYDQDAGPKLLERACDRFAAALLLPADEFGESVERTGLDPVALARVWRFSSVEAIARRLAEVVPRTSSAGWLELKAKWRTMDPGALEQRELEALGDAYHRSRGRGVYEGSEGVVRVWRTGSSPRSAVSIIQTA